MSDALVWVTYLSRESVDENVFVVPLKQAGIWEKSIKCVNT